MFSNLWFQACSRAFNFCSCKFSNLECFQIYDFKHSLAFAHANTSCIILCVSRVDWCIFALQSNNEGSRCIGCCQTHLYPNSCTKFIYVVLLIQKSFKIKVRLRIDFMIQIRFGYNFEYLIIWTSLHIPRLILKLTIK